MTNDYVLPIHFTAEQREHLDALRAQGVPAAVYVRQLVQRDMAVSKTGGVSGESTPLLSSADQHSPRFTEVPPSLTTEGDTPGYSRGAWGSDTTHPTVHHTRYPGDSGKGGGY